MGKTLQFSLKTVLCFMFVCCLSLYTSEANATGSKNEKTTVKDKTRKDRKVKTEKWPRTRREDDRTRRDRTPRMDPWPRTRREDDRTRRDRRPRMDPWPRTRRPRGGKDPKKSIPLDGGLGFLVLGAAAFGVRKLRKNK